MATKTTGSPALINFNVEEWFEGDRYETLAIRRSLELAGAAFEVAIPVDRREGGVGRAGGTGTS